MRYFDEEEAKKLNAEPWMTELLKMNPDYLGWGPHEDYMWVRNDDEGPDELGRKPQGGWTSRILVEDWSKFEIELDDLNEVVNFYFSVNRESKECETCGGSGYHPDAQWVSESFYRHSNPFRERTHDEIEVSMIMASFSGSLPRQPAIATRRFPTEETLSKYSPEFREFCHQMAQSGDGWSDKITQCEADALIESGRANPGETAEQINQKQSKRGLLSHDAINRGVLVRARCNRFGIPVHCDECNGDGYVYTQDGAHVSLTLWLLHPRKGASRGVEVKTIEQCDLPSVFAFLKEAASRNASRFSKLP